MKIILHSDQIQGESAIRDGDLLRSLSGKRNPSILYIPSIPEPRRRYFNEKKDYYTNINLTNCSYFDFADENSDELLQKFNTADILHLSGGDPFVFIERILSSKFDILIKKHIAKGGVIIAISAGAMLLGISIINTDKKPCYRSHPGLGIIPFDVVPHWSDLWIDEKSLQKHMTIHNTDVYAISDGDCVVVSSKKIKTYGLVHVISHQIHE